MNIEKYIPRKPINLFIEKIMYINIDMETLLSNPSVFTPNANVVLAIHLSNSMIYTTEGSFTLLPNMLFVGLLNQHVNLKPIGDISSIFVIFKPNALYHLLKIDMNCLNKNLYVNAVDVFGYSSKLLFDQLLSVNNISDRFRIIESYFESYLHNKMITDDIIDNVIESIIRDKGCIGVNDITEYFNIAERTLYHKFMIQTGLSPKEFIRLIRFKNIFNYVSKTSYVNWSDVINRYNLFDQSHLIREIKNFTGHTPKKLLSLNLEFIQAINGTIE